MRGRAEQGPRRPGLSKRNLDARLRELEIRGHSTGRPKAMMAGVKTISVGFGLDQRAWCASRDVGSPGKDRGGRV